MSFSTLGLADGLLRAVAESSQATWQVDEPASGVRIVRYHAVRTTPAAASKGARHVSLWQRQSGTGRWQLHFHQSTRVV